MHYALFVRRLQGGGYLASDGQRFLNGHVTLRHSLSQGRTFDPLHYQVIGSDVVQGADVGMVQRCHHARLALPPAAELRLYELHGDAAAQARVPGFVDHAHTAFAEFALDLIMADGVARPILAHAQQVRGGTKQARRIVLTQQVLDFGAQLRVALAGGIEKVRPLGFRPLASGTENFLDAAPAFRCHTASRPASCTRSHALAIAQSLFTVRGEMAMASAVSSTERPPKYRNSAMRACRGSTSLSRARISSIARISSVRPPPAHRSKRSSSNVTATPRLAAPRRRAWSTRSRRMICAATPTNCTRFCQSA